MKSFPLGAIILATLLLGQQAHAQSPHGNDNPTGVAGDFGGSITTGGGYDPYTGNGPTRSGGKWPGGGTRTGKATAFPTA
jgi:hypothetical protein